VDNLKLIHRTLGMFFVTTLKSNRLVSLSKEQSYRGAFQIQGVSRGQSTQSTMRP